MGIHGFTYAYDYYTPQKGVCFHMYAVRDHEEQRKRVPHFWENQKLYYSIGIKSMKRLNTIIQMDDFPPNEWFMVERKKYGLGPIRTPQKFFDTFGLHVKAHRVEMNLCKFVGLPMMKEFSPFLRKDRMGLDYDKIHYKFVDQGDDKVAATKKNVPIPLIRKLVSKGQ